MLNKLNPAILIVCLLFSLSRQSGAKHLADEFIKHDIKHDISSHIGNDLSKLAVARAVSGTIEEDLLKEPLEGEPPEKSPPSPPDPIKSPRENYDFHRHWLEASSDQSDALQFLYDNHVIIELNEELDFEYDEFKIDYSYLHFDVDDPAGHQHTVQFTNGGEKSYSVLFGNWVPMHFELKTRPNKKFQFKLEFSKVYQTGLWSDSEEVGSDEADDDKGDLDDDDKEPIRSEKRFTVLIQSLTVKFNRASGGKERTIQFDILNDNRFTAQVDYNRVSRDQLLNYLLLPQLTGGLTNYYYTFMNAVPFNWTLDNEKQTYTGDVCLQFSYQATKQSILKLKILNKQETSFFELLDLDGTEISFKESDAPKAPMFQRTKWTMVNICLRDLFPSSELNNFYRLRFESALPATSKRKDFVAITDIIIQAKDYAKKNIKNYLTNWKTNGSAAVNEWFEFSEDALLTIKTDHSGLKETSNLQYRLEGKPYTNPSKSVCVLSEWLEIEESEELRFEIVSEMVGARYRIIMFDYQMLALHSSDIIEIKRGRNSVEFKFSATIVSLLKNKPARVKLVITYDPKKENLNKVLSVTNLYLSDPCQDENLCNKRGECQTPTSNAYECVCDERFSGNNCEFENKCRTKDADGATGDIYCLKHNGIECVPVDNDFMCKCKSNYKWNRFTKNCEYVSSCLFKFCGINEVCQESLSKEPICRCKFNYSRDEKTKKCVFDLCKSLPEDQHCEENEICVSVVGEKERRCICPLENKMVDGKCLAEKLVDNPFIKQFHGCSHTYQIKNGQVVCACFSGYKLEDDGKTCSGDLSDQCSPKCKTREICVLNKKNNKPECRCQLGFQGVDCLKNYCDSAPKEEIYHICGTDSCVEQKYTHRDRMVGFSCNCDKRVSHESDETGLCVVKPVCDEKNVKLCAERNAICVPKLDPEDHFLKKRCVCRKGYLEDFSDPKFTKEGKCVKMCEAISSFFPNKTTYQKNCVIDFVTNTRSFDCDPGFVYNKEKESCEAGKNLLKINFDFKLRNLDTVENEHDTPKIQYTGLEFYCENMTTVLQCIEQMNQDRTNEHWIERDDADYYLAYLQSKVTRSIERSLRNLINPKRLQRIVIVKFEKNGETIDFENEGLHSIFSVELFVETDEKESADVIRQSLETTCLKDPTNSNEQENPTRRITNGQIDAAGDVPGDTDPGKAPNCVIMPYLYLMKSEMKISEVNLCDQKLVDCLGNTNCEHIRDKTNRSSYRCKCNHGFEPRFSVWSNNIEINSCTDIDECADEKLNNCNLTSTTCENRLGTFRCNCKENYKYVNGAHCALICVDQNLCIHGTCIVYEKNYDACVCHDGYKGEDCNSMIQKVIDLRSLLVIITILLLLFIMSVIVFTYIYVKKVECEDEQRLLKNEQMIPMSDVNNNRNSNQDRIDIRNMPRHSVHQDVIEEEEITDDEHVTDF